MDFWTLKKKPVINIILVSGISSWIPSVVSIYKRDPRDFRV